MNKLRSWLAKVIGFLGQLLVWVAVLTIILGGIIVLIKEIQWIIRLFGGM